MTAKTSGGKKPTPRKVSPKTAVPEEALPNGPDAVAKAGSGPKGSERPAQEGRSLQRGTAQVLRDADAGKNLLHYPSLTAMFEDLGI